MNITALVVVLTLVATLTMAVLRSRSEEELRTRFAPLPAATQAAVFARWQAQRQDHRYCEPGACAGC